MAKETRHPCDTFAILERNTKPYGDRVRTYRAGVWSHPADLVIVGTDAEAWARQVREAAVDEKPELRAVDIPVLLAESGMERISLLT